MNIDIIKECRTCKGYSESIFGDIPVTNETKIPMYDHQRYPCPRCRTQDWVIVIRPAEGKPLIVESLSRIGGESNG